jgi:hypothetical protein
MMWVDIRFFLALKYHTYELFKDFFIIDSISIMLYCRSIIIKLIVVTFILLTNG